MKKLILVGLVFTLSFSISGLELAKKSEALSKGYKSSISKLKMIMKNSSGESTQRDISLKNLELESGDRGLMEFLSPKKVKGTKLLTYEKIDRDDDQWLYLPALKRVKRIVGKGKSGSFMGSEFSYEDLGNQDYRKFSLEDRVELVNIDGVECYKNTRIPNDKKSGYTKQIIYVNKATFLVKKIEYFDRKKELLKVATFSDYKKSKNIYRVGKIEMINMQNHKFTSIQWVEDKIFASLKKRDFSKRVLKK